MLRRIVVSLTASAIALAVVGCDGDGPPEATPTPSVTSTPTESPSSSPSASATVPAYLEQFSEEERTAFHAAVRDYKRFAERNAEFYAEGRATPDARAFYKQHTAAWQSYWARLQRFEDQGYQTVGRGETLRIRPAGIRLSEDSGTIDLRVCGIATGVELLQNGTPVPQPTPRATIVRVRMVLLSSETTWRLLHDKVGQPC